MKVQLINVALGLWLMAAPAVLDYAAPAATSDRIIGPVIASFATVAIWEATRGLGRLNIAFGLWLVVAPAVLAYPLDALLNSIGVGASVVALSISQGKAKQQFGGGWSALWSRDASSSAARADGGSPDEEGASHASEQT